MVQPVVVYAPLSAGWSEMTQNYLAVYGMIAQAAGEATEAVMGLKAKIRGKCFGPSRELQDEVRRVYESDVLERLQLISRLIVELGKMRPRRFAKAFNRLLSSFRKGPSSITGLSSR